MQLVRGIQADPTPPKDAPHETQYPARAAASLKHFIAYSAPSSGRDRAPVYMPERELRQHFLPPWRAAIDAGALTVMEAYHELNDVPMVASHALLQAR